MIVCIDYDQTYTADKRLWDAFIQNAKERGHRVVCATMRFETEPISIPCEVVYTCRKAKAPFLESKGIRPDIFIDDTPQFLFRDSP